MTTLAELAARASDQITFLDVERFPGEAVVEHHGSTITCEFWDLNHLKPMIRRRIRPDEVTRWPRVISLAWSDLAEDAVHFTAEWHRGADALAETMWHVYDRADVVVGHHVRAFDTKHVKTEWWSRGMTMPSPWKTTDTLTIARRELGAESRALDPLCKRAGFTGKDGRYDVEVARRALAGSVEDRHRLADYNRADVRATKHLWMSLRGWDSTAPFAAIGTDAEPVCNQCGSTALALQAKPYRAQLIAYALFRCDACGAWLKGGWHSRRSRVVGVRA